MDSQGGRGAGRQSVISPTRRRVTTAAACIAALALGGCASEPPATQGHAPRTPTEVAAANVVKSGIPACQPGHANDVQDDEIRVTPGTTVCVRLKVVGDTVVPVAVVDKFDPADTLVVRMWQSSEHDATYLDIHNPLAGFLRYRAWIRRAGGVQFEYTDTCAVVDQLNAFEQWPYPIEALVMRDMVTIPASDTITCQ